jgi:transposase
MWCVPKLDDEFRMRMEDVLTLYERPFDSAEPVLCLDEQPQQLLDDTRPSERAAPGRIAKQDYEYRRCGTCSAFLAIEPQAGRRHVWARRRRAKPDFARVIRELVKRYPRARKIHLVLDNLNTHKPASLVETFGKKAAQILKRIEWHFTPKHASWLNMAEIELSVLTKQCLSRRIPTLAQLQRETAAWTRRRNRAKARIEWKFKVHDARRAFPELYRKKLVG